jgi:radical SAM superfamily enzyme YgiQ (UPF0313 family)
LAKSLDEVAGEVALFKPDIVGLSTMTLNFSVAVELSVKLKKVLPSKTILCAGGVHPTALPGDTLRRLPVDFVVVGEGEEAISAVCKTYRKRTGKIEYQDIGSVAYINRRGKLVENPSLIVEDLDFLPFPAFDLLDMDVYMRPPGFIRGLVFERVATVMFSRGCPYHCTYCSSYLMFKGKTRFHTPEYMMALLKLMKKAYDIDAYYFTDETLTLNHRLMFDLCKRLKSLHLPWGCSTRVNVLTWELLCAMREAGCLHIDFGVESGSQRIRDVLRRRQNQKMFEETFEMCKKLDIRQFAQVMVGCPTETKKDVQMTVDMLKIIKPTYTMVSIFTPLPGTDAYANSLPKLRPLSKYIKKLNDFDIANTDHPLVNVSGMTDKEILEGRSRILQAMLWHNYGGMLTRQHFKFFFQCLWASLSYIPRTLQALAKAVSQKRIEFIVYMLVFNYVEHYRPTKKHRRVRWPAVSPVK